MSSRTGSQYNLFPLQYDCVAMMHTRACENPLSTVAFGCLRACMASSQFTRWPTSSSSGPSELGGGAPGICRVVSPSLDGPCSGVLAIYRTGLPGIPLLPPSFLGGDEKGCALATVVFDRSVPAHNAREAPVAVPEGRLVGVEEPFGIGHSRHTGIWIFPVIVPDEDATVRDHARGMGLVCPKMYQVAAVAEPLVEYPGGKLLVEPEFKINMGIEWPVWFAQQPTLPVSVLFAELGSAGRRASSSTPSFRPSASREKCRYPPVRNASAPH